MRKAEVQVFTFDELGVSVKQRAVADYLQEIVKYPQLDMRADDDPIRQAFDEAHRLRTPWFVGEMIAERVDLAAMLSEEGLEFLADGRIWRSHLYENPKPEGTDE